MMIKKLINLNFISLSLNNVLNLVFPSFLFFILILSNHNILASDVAINTSILILLTKSLSANQRNIILSSESVKMLDKFIFFRLELIIVVLILTLILNYFFISVNEINIIFIFIFCTQWINEICLVRNELIENKRINNYFFLINIIFFGGICFFAFFLYNYLFFFLLAYFMHITIFSLIFLKNKKLFNVFFDLKGIYLNLIKYFKTNFFLSGFALNLANLIWRISIIWLVGKNYASIFFAIFSLGSFPGTIFSSSFGVTMVKKKINHLYLVVFFIIYIFLLILFYFFLSNNFSNFISKGFFDPNFLVYIVVFTFIGSVITLYSLYNRQIYIDRNPNFGNSIFKKDIFLSIFISLIPILLYLIGGANCIGFSYFVLAIISYIFYIR
jgi:hypothetical protein